MGPPAVVLTRFDGRLPSGNVRSLGVAEILYQPETAGDFHL